MMVIPKVILLFIKMAEHKNDGYMAVIQKYKF